VPVSDILPLADHALTPAVTVSFFFRDSRENISKGPKNIRSIRKEEKEILEKEKRNLKFSFLRNK
jgi:hypothetical protein